MIRANIGLSRKLSKDFNSTGFSINLENEINAPLHDPEAVIEQVRQLYNLGAEILDREIEAYQSDAAIAGRDAPVTVRPTRSGSPPEIQNSAPSNTVNEAPGATEKQVNYLLSLGKRNRLSTLELDQRISGVLGRSANVYQLSKQEAARVIDSLQNSERTTQA